MTTGTPAGITVYTTTGNTYVVPGAAVPPAVSGAPTGELNVQAVTPPDADGNQQWLAEFGSVEAVWAGGAVTQVSPAAQRGGL